MYAEWFFNSTQFVLGYPVIREVVVQGKRGRPITRIAIEGPWEDAMGRALKKKVPARGFTEKPAKKRKMRRKKKAAK